MSAPRLRRCLNCKGLPVWQKGDATYPHVLTHQTPLCSARFGMEIWHKTKALCAAKWNQHVQQLEASP